MFTCKPAFRRGVVRGTGDARRRAAGNSRPLCVSQFQNPTCGGDRAFAVKFHWKDSAKNRQTRRIYDERGRADDEQRNSNK